VCRVCFVHMMQWHRKTISHDCLKYLLKWMKMKRQLKLCS